MKVFLSILILGALACAQDAPKEPAKPASISLEKLEARMADLTRGKEQAIANVNAIVGAIQETQHWLDELKAPADTPGTAKSVPPRGRPAVAAPVLSK